MNIILLMIAFSFIVVSTASGEFVVQTIYFQPTDSEDNSDALDIDNMMKSIQDTYRNEMDRHGFGDKTFELETNKEGEVVLHKVKGDRDKAHYSFNTGSIVIKELENKGYNDKHTFYNVIMAGMRTVQGGAGGTARARPWGAWFGNGDSQYSGYCISTEKDRDRTEQIIRHELGHLFGLWHLSSDESMMGLWGWGDKLNFHEARWLSRNHYFNGKWHHSFGPNTIKFHGAKVFEFDKISFSATISDRDNDDIFQVYAWVNSNIIGWQFFDGTKHTVDVVIDSVSRNALPNSGSITFQAMDIHGNWMIDFPQSYSLPAQINKNPDLNVVKDDIEEDFCAVCDTQEDVSLNITSKNILATSWAAIKSE